MKKFIFDVDGTLTPSRKQMDVGFSAEFLYFVVSLILTQ